MLHSLDGPIYAGLAGLELASDEIELGDGVVLRKTYAHLMAPFLMAFSPAPDGGPHPAPWKAATGGFGFDIVAELVVPIEAAESPEGRIEIARLIVALMRLWAAPQITLPVISNISFSAAADAPDDEAHFIPLEIEPRRFRLVAPEGRKISDERLRWVRNHWKTAQRLRRENAEIEIAIGAVDRGQFVISPALALLSLWGALEAIFSPATTELRFRVSVLIASYMEPPGLRRRELHKEIMRLYNQRSAAAHGKPKADTEGLLQTFELLRQVLIKIISEGHAPARDELEGYLFGDLPEQAEDSI